MRIAIPITGTVLVEGEVHGDGALTGDPNDPIRIIDLDLGHISWTMVDVDLDNEVMIIEVTPNDIISEPELDAEGKQRLDPEGSPVFKPSRETTKQEKAKFLQDAQHLVESRTKDELYAMSKCPRLKRPVKEKK